MKKLIKTISCSLPFFLVLIFGGCNKSNTPISPAVNELIEFGFNRIIFGLPSADADTVLPLVEKLAAFAHDY